MKKEINWDIDSPFYTYPREVKKIYLIKFLRLRKNFSDWIGKISGDFYNDVEWWSSVSSSRNPYYSNLYKFICVIETIKEIRNKFSLKLIISSNSLYSFLEKEKLINNNLKVDLRKSNKLGKNIASYFKSIIFQTFIFFYTNFFFSKKKITQKILIHTYPNTNLNKIERLFPFSKDFIKKNYRRYAFVPSFIITGNFFFIIKVIFKLSKLNYIFKEHHLSFYDLIHTYKVIFRLKKFKKKYKKFNNIDLSEIIYEDIRDLRNFHALMLGILNYKFVKNLKYEKNEIKKAFSWHENHELRGWNLGFRTFLPNVKTFGYQGFTTLPPLMNAIPTKYEEKFKVIPEILIVISKYYKKTIKEFNKKLTIKVGPALIYRNIFKKFKKKNNIKFLVVLNEFLSTNKNILDWIKYIDNHDLGIVFYIKKPKILDMSHYISLNRNRKNIIFTDEFLPDLLKQSQFVITSGLGLSSVALEALAYGCKLIIPFIEPYDKEFFKILNVKKKYFKVFMKKKDLLSFLKNNRNISKPLITIKDIQNIKKKYFNIGNEKIFT